jgi:hypothetical protein
MTPETPKLTRAEQSRLNGAKSKGPITPEGKANSSSNAIKHGFAAHENVVLAVEDEADWLAHLDSFRTSFLPQCYVEQRLVDHLASINWRQSRLIAIETALIDVQMSIQDGNVQIIHPDACDNPYFNLVLAWQGLVRQPQPAPRPNPDEPHNPTLPPDRYDLNSIELVAATRPRSIDGRQLELPTALTHWFCYQRVAVAS